jgi:hypothetical protein
VIHAILKRIEWDRSGTEELVVKGTYVEPVA